MSDDTTETDDSTGTVRLNDLPEPEYEGSVDPDDLHVDGDNPNEQNDETFGLLCDNIRKKGWLGGPIVTDTDGLIADGEHRWRAAQEIGLSEVPVKQYDIDDPERRLIRQELNKISGEHDAKRDALEYDYLLDNGKTDDVQALTNAADEDLDELLASIKVPKDQTPIYEYDPEHNVYFEDCVEGMREHLADDSVDMVFTSPPYNVDIDYGEYDDDQEEEEYHAFVRDVFSELSRVVKPNGHIFVNHQHTFQNAEVSPNDWLADAMPVTLRSYIIWAKEKGVKTSLASANNNGAFVPNWEFLLHFSESPRPLKNTPQYGIWRVNSVAGRDAGEHPASFPTDLVRRGIEATTSPGDVVLDPFMGSGTTAVAAIQNNRDYVGFELDEESYRSVIERRIGEATRQMESPQNAESDD